MASELTELGTILRSICKAKGIKQTDLAKRMGIDRSGISKRFRENFSLEALKEMCDYLGVDLCIIDGWNKHKLNKGNTCNIDLDRFMSEMRDRVGSMNSIDTVGRRIEKIKEHNRKQAATQRVDREAYNAKMVAYNREHKEELKQRKAEREAVKQGMICRKCIYYERRLEPRRTGAVYCRHYGDYKAVTECEKFRDRKEVTFEGDI